MVTFFSANEEKTSSDTDKAALKELQKNNAENHKSRIFKITQPLRCKNSLCLRGRMVDRQPKPDSETKKAFFLTFY